MYIPIILVNVQNPNWGVQIEPISTSLTPVQGDDLTIKAIAVFKLVSF